MKHQLLIYFPALQERCIRQIEGKESKSVHSTCYVEQAVLRIPAMRNIQNCYEESSKFLTNPLDAIDSVAHINPQSGFPSRNIIRKI